MATIQSYVKGALITFVARFKDSGGVAIVPVSATLYINHGGGIDSVEMDAVSDGSFTYDWASGSAQTGSIYWHIQSDDAAMEGVFDLVANKANPS